MPDAAVPLLLHEILVYAELLVEIAVYVQLADVVKEVEVEIFHTALLELRLEYLFDLVHVREVVAGELVREVKLFARMPRERASHYEL